MSMPRRSDVSHIQIPRVSQIGNVTYVLKTERKYTSVIIVHGGNEHDKNNDIFHFLSLAFPRLSSFFFFSFPPQLPRYLPHRGYPRARGAPSTLPVPSSHQELPLLPFIARPLFRAPPHAIVAMQIVR